MKTLLLVAALGLSWVACSHTGAVPESRGTGAVPEPQRAEAVPEPGETLACPTEPARAEVLLRVVDVEGRPIPGARIALNPGTLDVRIPAQSEEGPVTDADGKARLTPRVEPGKAPSVIVTAEGYLGGYRALDLVPGEQQRVDVRLIRSAVVSGRVVDIHGKPLPGAEVSGTSASVHRSGGPVTTDAEGRFSLKGLPAGPVALKVSHGGQVPTRRRVIAPRTDVELQWLTSTLDVEVRDAEGQPLPGIKVQLQAVSPARELWELKTDARGRGEHVVLPPARVRAQASWEREGFQWSTTSEVLLVAGQHHSLVLSFEGSRVRPPLTGKVVDAAGRPLSEVDVVATSLTKHDPGSVPDMFVTQAQHGRSQALSDAQGRFTLNGLREGGVRVQASHRGALYEDSPPVEVPPGQDEVTLVLERWSSVQGQVVDPQGRPVTDFFVNDTFFSHPEGRFEDVVVPEGRVTLTFTSDWFAVERRTLQVPARTQFRLTEPIVLQHGRTVSGRVVKADGCTPIREAVVMLDREDPPTDDTLDPVATRTDADGRFQLDRLKQEPLVLRVGKWPTYPWGLNAPVPVVRVPVTADADSVTVRFGPEVSLTGVVMDSEGRPLGHARLATDCTRLVVYADAAGRYVMHGLEAGRACSISAVSHWEVGELGRSTPLPVFTPRRIVLPERGTLRVDLSARRGPASLVVELSRWDVLPVLLEGDVPMPSTWEQFLRLRGKLTPDPEPSRTDEYPKPLGSPGASMFSQLPLGHYTLLVGETRPGLEGLAMVRVPVRLTRPGPKRVEVTFSEAQLVTSEAERRRP